MNWTEKYRPNFLKEVVGNKQSISKFKNWMNEFLNGKTKKVALLYGPTGVGKTSSVYAIANEFDFDVIELNASDQRNYQMIKRIAGSAVENYSINQKNKIILFDEADNLYGTSDKNGVRGIREILKRSIYPVVLTANDIKKVPKDVRNLCTSIKFDILKDSEVLFVLKNICIYEGIDLDIQILKKIAKNNHDLRAAINDLYALSTGVIAINESIPLSISERDHDTDIYSLLQALFHKEDYSAAAQILHRIDETPEDVILWINENIFNIYEDDVGLLNVLNNLSLSDRYLGRIYIRQDYRFWKYATDLMLMGVLSSDKKNKKSHFYINFPKRWILLGKIKQRRELINGVCFKIAKTYNISMKKAKSHILPFLKKIYDDDISDKLKKEIGLTDVELSLIFNKNDFKKLYLKHKKDVFKKETIKPEKVQKSIFDF